MNAQENEPAMEGFPYDLSVYLGTILKTECQCPGVWYVASEGGGRAANEYYIVERSSPSISAAAKEYGLPLPHHTDLLAYHLEHPQGGRSVVAYEVARWCVRNGKPTPDGETLLTTAAYAMENNPEYFGNFPAPIHTPRGAMTRYKPIINGVFALETEQGKRMIAVCYPLWSAALSGYTMSVAEQTEYDLAHGIDTTLGYLFFAEEHGCLALFELLEEFPEILSSPLIAAAALGNAIWHNHPDYAAVYNRDEQDGLHDCLAVLLRALGAEEVEPNISVDHLIRLTTGVGTDYLVL